MIGTAQSALTKIRSVGILRPVKRILRYLVNALQVLVCVLSIATLVAAATIPSWLQLKAGVRAFTGDDGGDATMATICPSLRLYIHGPDNAAAPRCAHEKRGASIVVESIVARSCVDFESQARVPCVRIRAANGSWSGYTGATTVIPAIPVGTLLVLTPQPNEHLTLASKPISGPDDGTDLGARARARVLGFVPSADARELHVMIVSGSHAGASGWVYAHTATIDGLSVTEFRY